MSKTCSGRGFALAFSSLLFASLHANWAGFLPLAVLGAVFALAYEQTGDFVKATQFPRPAASASAAVSVPVDS